MYAPAISPHDPNLLFVACDMGGVYRSADGGATWTMLDKRQLRDAACCPVVFHPRDDRSRLCLCQRVFQDQRRPRCDMECFVRRSSLGKRAVHGARD